jgi:flagellar biosynthesis protein FlhB
MSEPDSDGEKNHEPTEKRLQDARKKGQIVRSTELTTAAAYGGYFVAFSLFGTASLYQFGDLFRSIYVGPPSGGGQVMFEALRQSLLYILPALFPILLVPAVIAFFSVAAQRAVTITPDNIRPKLDRISPLKNAKKKFGPEGLFEFLKSSVKLLLFSFILFLFAVARVGELPALIGETPGRFALYSGEILKTLFRDIFFVALFIGVVDYFWQRGSHLKRMRMTHKEMMDEMKETEGDPHFKGVRRNKGQEIVMRQVASEVPKADVVIVNPTHYAVALKWSKKRGEAPVCLAKGVDEIAAKMREIAQKNGVPVHSDPPTARAIFATVKVGAEITPEHYQAVAAAIKFAENMRERARAWRR